MAMCEDFPCCGHEMGCCPRFDDAGRQLDMVCTCGARLPVNNRYSICDGCLRQGMEEDGCYDEYEDDCDDDEDEVCDDDCNDPEDGFLDSYMEDRMGGGGDF
jgi:hypothetical protein